MVRCTWIITSGVTHSWLHSRPDTHRLWPRWPAQRWRHSACHRLPSVYVIHPWNARPVVTPTRRWNETWCVSMNFTLSSTRPTLKYLHPDQLGKGSLRTCYVLGAGPGELFCFWLFVSVTGGVIRGCSRVSGLLLLMVPRWKTLFVNCAFPGIQCTPSLPLS